MNISTSNFKKILITATTGNSTTSWSVDIHNVLNPFFSPDNGNNGATVFVFTNDKKMLFKSVSVQINNKLYPLQNLSVPNNETQWSLFLRNDEFVCYGNDIQIINAVSLDNLHNYSEVLPKNARGFEKVCLIDNNPPGSGSGSSGSSRSSKDSFSLIYVILDNEVVGINEAQKITLDIESTNSLADVKALFSAPDGGTFTLELEKTKGTNYYGTWQTNVPHLSLGSYTLKTILVRSKTGDKNFSIASRSFYVVGEDVDTSEHLILVYTLLDKSKIDQISNVTFKLDARDIDGIKNVTAVIKRTHGENSNSFIIPLKLISGDAKYGTWEGVFEVNEADTTYNVDSIKLTNDLESKTYPIFDRSVYATNSLPVDFSSFITGNVVGFNVPKIFKGPFAPVILGFIILLMVALILLIFHKLSKVNIKAGD